MNKYLFILGLFLCACNSESEIGSEKAIATIKSMSKLGTTEYSFKKIVSTEDNEWYTIGSKKLMMSCKANVIAGIDAGQIQFTEVDTKAKKIKLTIPSVEIITFSIPPSEFEFYDDDVSIFRSNFTSTEIDQIQKMAEDAIKNQVKELNITSETEKNAIKLLDKILRSVGFVSIEIKTTPQAKLF